MATTPVSAGSNLEQPQDGGSAQFLRVILADTQAIFRAGLRKIFAVEDDIRVVGQAETLPQTLSAAKKFSADILIFEAALAPNPPEAVADLLRQTPKLRVVVVTAEPNEELTLELFRRGAYGIVSREVEPEVMVDCLRQVAKGEPWLDKQSTSWVLAAYRTQASRPLNRSTRVQLTPKESLIVSCVTQGMKNKEIAQKVGTTEQVVKNYLRKVYDKLGVADRLELALYCLQNRIGDNSNPASPAPTAPANGAAAAQPTAAVPVSNSSEPSN